MSHACKIHANSMENHKLITTTVMQKCVVVEEDIKREIQHE